MNEGTSPVFSSTQPLPLINRTSITFECMWAFNAHVARLKRRTVSNIVWTALWSVMLTVWIVLAVIRPSTTASLALLLCAVAVAGHVYMLIFMNVILKRRVQKHPHIGGQYAFTFEEDHFTEDFTSSDAASQSRILYSALLKVEETERYLYLFNQPSTAFLIDKNGFTQGSAEELKALLRQKLSPDKLSLR